MKKNMKNTRASRGGKKGPIWMGRIEAYKNYKTPKTIKTIDPLLCHIACPLIRKPESGIGHMGTLNANCRLPARSKQSTRNNKSYEIISLTVV